MVNKTRVLINKKILKENYKFLKNYGEVYYTLKANSNAPMLLQVADVLQETDGYCISRFGDMKLLQNVNVNRICCINVLLSVENLKHLYEKGLRKFVFDDFNKLKEFSKIANLNDCEIIVRLNISEFYGKKLSHLGSTMDEFNKIYKLIENCKGIGISLYFQSSITKNKKYMKKAYKFINLVLSSFDKVATLNVGGLKQAKDYEYLKILKSKYKNLRIVIESGRSLLHGVAELEGEILSVRNIKNTDILILRNGIFTGFMDVAYYNKKFALKLQTSEGEIGLFSNKKTGTKKLLVFGGSGDSADFLGKYYVDKKVKLDVQNKIIVQDVGQYFLDFFFEYGSDFCKEEVLYEVKDEI